MKYFKICRRIYLCMPLLLFVMSCSVFQWERDVVENGIPFSKFRQDASSGTMIGFTQQNFVMDSFEVQKGWVHFYPGWKLRTFQTARPVEMVYFKLPTGTWLFLDSTGQISSCVLPEDQEVQGINCRGGGGVSGIYTGFYPSGRLRGCYPVDDIEIDGIPCSNSLLFPVGLYEDGHLQSCKLSREFKRGSATYKKGTCIKLETDGSITVL